MYVKVNQYLLSNLYKIILHYYLTHFRPTVNDTTVFFHDSIFYYTIVR